jgi:hypothetical protein
MQLYQLRERSGEMQNLFKKQNLLVSRYLVLFQVCYKRVRIKSEKQILAASCLSVCLSVCLPTCFSMIPTDQIFVKFDIGNFYENLSRNPRLGLKRAKNIGHHVRRHKYVYIVDHITKYFAAKEQRAGNSFLRFHGNIRRFLCC